MKDIELEISQGGAVLGEYNFELHGSVGKVVEQFPRNFDKREVPAPGPCFSFGASIPGGMSGGPIFDREGIYVHGVVSKGWDFESSDEKLAFGSMLRPSMALPISRLGGASLEQLQKEGKEGIGVLRAADL